MSTGGSSGTATTTSATTTTTTTAASPVDPEPLTMVHGPPLLARRLKARLAASAAILVDADTGQVLWSLHPHQRRPIASTTKIMTALL
ncbi:MAG TPA: hypothetical protein VNH40_08675, partial [Gaiellaceae bacterium]|nr:hypothetical protein [Gaiellaceae bacterium]